MKYEVRGSCVVDVCLTVEADNEEDAMDIAEETLDNLTEYCGNGGSDKLVGVDLEEASVHANNYIEWNDVGEYDE